MARESGEMPDDNTTPAGETPVGTPVAPTQDTPDAPSAAELIAENARMRDALKAANSESASRRKKLEEYEKAEQERKDAELSETDRLNKKLAEAEAAKQQALSTANERLIRAAFVAQAALAGAEFPNDAFLLAERAGVTIDDDGNVTGVAEAVKAIVESGRLPLKDKRRAPSLDAGAGGSQSPAGSKPALTEAELQVARRMGITPEQYAAHKQK
jgi:hypothetical protein